MRIIMSEPLFLASCMHDKIWGGTKLREVFGYQLPTETTGEYWAISAHPNGVSRVSSGSYQGQRLDQLYAEKPELFGYPKEKVFPLLTKILDRKSTRLNSSHANISYAVFCLKKKITTYPPLLPSY